MPILLYIVFSLHHSVHLQLFHFSIFVLSGYCPPPHATPIDVEERAEHCNDKKLTAKYVADTSAEMFFGLFIKVRVEIYCSSLNVNF